MELELKIKLILIGLIFSSLVLSIAYRSHFFRVLTPLPFFNRLNLGQVLGAFIVFLSIPVFVVPMGIFLFLWIQNEPVNSSGFNAFTPLVKGWANLSLIFATALGVGVYAFKYGDIVGKMFDPFNKGFKWCLKQFGMGLLTCLIALPLVLTVSQVLDAWIFWQFKILPVEQVAVVHLRSLSDYPYLFAATLLCVATLVPLTEEILFRGFLQTWLMDRIGQTRAIALTALIFALFHYATQQSIYNVQIVGTLFILALFLGYIYARQKSLWAPVALHMLFNFFGTCIIFFES